MSDYIDDMLKKLIINQKPITPLSNIDMKPSSLDLGNIKPSLPDIDIKPSSLDLGNIKPPSLGYTEIKPLSLDLSNIKPPLPDIDIKPSSLDLSASDVKNNYRINRYKKIFFSNKKRKR